MLELVKPFNIILAADAYKFGHWLEVPPFVKKTYTAVVPRKPNARLTEYNDEIVAAGQNLVAYILSKTRVTEEMIDEAEIEIIEQGYQFNRAGWELIARDYGGRLPLLMYAVEEGRIVRPQTPVLGLINSDEASGWLPAYVESWVQSIIWGMSSLASIARNAKRKIKKYMELTGSDMSMLDYKLHNFGDRAVLAPEEGAAIAGIAHAMLFSGSDCARANGYIKKLYGTSKFYTSSVEAFEHSTVCANSDTETKNDFGAAKLAVIRLKDVVERVARTGVGVPVLSVVIDTYDDERFVQDFLGTVLHDDIVNSGGCLVARPDSGDPTVKPGQIGRILANKFGTTVNSAGYEVLAPCIGVLQGDGIRIDTLDGVLRGWVDVGFSLDNFVLGMGHGTSNDVSRDDWSWSMKAIANMDSSGRWTRLLKEPVSDLGKTSLSGLVRCREDAEGNLEVFDAMDTESFWEFFTGGAGWQLYCKDGFRVYKQSFDDVRSWANKGI